MLHSSFVHISGFLGGEAHASARPYFRNMLLLLRACKRTHPSLCEVCLLSRLHRCISACIDACVIVRACPLAVCMHGCSQLPPACSDPLSHGLCSGTREAAASRILRIFPPAREKHRSASSYLAAVSKVIVSIIKQEKNPVSSFAEKK